jgi:Methyltransferase domain
MSGAGTDLADLSFDLYSRHRILSQVADCARKTHDQPVLDILDVGGFPCYAPRFLPGDRVVVVDVIDPDGAIPTARYLRADGAALPFADGAFDVVSSLDSLEHVPPTRREAYVEELLRVSRRYVLILAPFAQPETDLVERVLAEFVRVFDQEESPQLEEHHTFGLPELPQWTEFVRSAGFECVSFPSGYVYNWLPMMLVKYYLVALPDTLDLHHALDRFYNTLLQESDTRAPGYRQCILASRDAASPVLTDIAAALAPRPSPDRLEVIERMAQIDLLLKLADLHVKWRRDEALRDDVIAKEQHIANLADQLATERTRADALEAHVQAIQNGRAMRALAAVNRLLGRSS